MTTLLKKLHEIAILRGWYKDITTGLPLNVIRTVFGTHALEGIYTMTPIGELLKEMYDWGHHDAQTWTEENNALMQCRLDMSERALSVYKATSAPQYGEWRSKKDGSGYYRRVKLPCRLPMWTTESVKTLPE
jgi:hypothetical protein